MAVSAGLYYVHKNIPQRQSFCKSKPVFCGHKSQKSSEADFFQIKACFAGTNRRRRSTLFSARERSCLPVRECAEQCDRIRTDGGRGKALHFPQSRPKRRPGRRPHRKLLHGGTYLRRGSSPDDQTRQRKSRLRTEKHPLHGGTLQRKRRGRAERKSFYAGRSLPRAPRKMTPQQLLPEDFVFLPSSFPSPFLCYDGLNSGEAPTKRRNL